MTVNNTDTHDTIQMSPKSMSSVNSNPSFRMNQPFNTNSNNYSTSYSRNYDNNYRIANNRNMNSSPKFSPSSYSQAPQNKNRFNNNPVRNHKQEFSKHTNDNSRRNFQNQQSYSSNNNYSRQYTTNTINPSYTSTDIERLQESVSDIPRMDYINLYNLSFDVKHQTISIEYRKRLLTMNIEPDYKISPCNAIQTCNASLNSNVEALVKTIENEKYRNNLRTLLVRFSATFDISKHNIAKTSIHHVINTVPHSPPACKPYPQPDKEQAMYQLMQEFLQAGLITESHSPYAAPPILIKKKDSSYRFVVDYKKLNLITIKDSSPLPNMEDTIRKLGHGYSCFSKLDLKSGFYQISINNADKEKTAFVTPFGLYQFNVLPMGLKNSPPTFQKVMTDTLKNCRNYSLVYLDDIIIFSKSFEQHLCHLECVISALKEKNLVLNPPKCVFATNKIDYLGHTVSKKYITPMKEKIEAILQLKEPHSLSQANKFIGALSWYRKFIPHFATVAAPIHSVTNLTKDNRHKFKWKYAQSKAFHELKQMLVREPLFLHYPIDDIPLILTTDASGIGIGGVLQQEVEGEMHNLYYHSQLMTICERKYSTIEKEALAIYKCFTRMRTFLLGRNIVLKTDHCPLCHIMEKTVRNARVDRITHLLQEYNIDKVVHIKGRENCLPDFLSRYSNEMNDDLLLN
ncbi:unnamed protein product [Rotaria magnacalcarata]|uniref:Reverse transcriptase domain-containing protein n=2 Tax=Rotaria magnacalcarata TaxID=392030 RepID=A0A8S2VAS2_9BILA|nr:unnamed protein product [Rotaria magnacalcarata]